MNWPAASRWTSAASSVRRKSGRAATERIDPPMIEVEVFDDPALSIQAIRAITGASIQLNLSSGKRYVLYNAFQTDKLELDAVEGKFTLKMSGTDCVETTTGS
jgi:hypothetical protein